MHDLTSQKILVLVSCGLRFSDLLSALHVSILSRKNPVDLVA